MTLEFLNGVMASLEEQHRAILASVPTAEKPVIAHCNAIELHGAMQLMKQLISQEQIALQAPPGATGPAI